MLSVFELWQASVDIDEAPQVLADDAFRAEIVGTLASINGGFSSKVVERSIDERAAGDWFEETQGLAGREAFEIEEAADLSVRLAALSYIMSEAPVNGADPLDLLVRATVLRSK